MAKQPVKPQAGLFYDELPTGAEALPLIDTPPPVEKLQTQPAQKYLDTIVEEDSNDHHPDSLSVGNLINLPSKGALGYPSTISYREVMAGDEEILKSATNKNFSRTINRVLKDICNDVEWFDDLYVGDRDYVMSYIWANTYDNEKEFEVKCRHCGTQGDLKIDMFALPMIEMKDNFRPNFPLTIKKTGDVVKLRMVTVRDDNNAEKFIAENPKTQYSFEMVHYAMAIDFGRPMRMADKVEYLKNNVSAKEMGIIKQYHQHFSFGMDTTYEHVCSECSGVTRGQIPFQPEDIIAPKVRTDFDSLLHDVEGT